MCKFIRKSDEWILHKPTVLTILGLFFNIHVAMSAIEILRLTNVMSYKYIFCLHQIWTLYRPKES